MGKLLKRIETEWPRIGSGVNSYNMVLSKNVSREFAKQAGMTQREAQFFVRLFGKVIQDLLLQGIPCGIPYLGTLAIRYLKNRKFSLRQIMNRNPYLTKDKVSSVVEFPVYPKLFLHMTESVKQFYRDSIPYTGDLVCHYNNAFRSDADLRKLNNKLKQFRKQTNRDGYQRHEATLAKTRVKQPTVLRKMTRVKLTDPKEIEEHRSKLRKRTLHRKGSLDR